MTPTKSFLFILIKSFIVIEIWLDTTVINLPFKKCNIPYRVYKFYKNLYGIWILLIFANMKFSRAHVNFLTMPDKNFHNAIEAIEENGYFDIFSFQT